MVRALAMAAPGLMATFPLAVRNAQLDAHNAKLLARVALETGGNVREERERKILSRLGDERQLRGIPAIGRGVAGAIAGSSPHGVAA